ncbi:MAG: ribonuclease HII, partial [Propionibacteriales bacterium]|nr:ribonuclease HII [Propionibacteriales bacterium]
KLMTAAARDRAYDEIIAKAEAWAVAIVEPDECDRLGMHVANIQALRRALFRLDTAAAYVLTDGFPVDGLGAPGLSVWKGDRVAACVAAASVMAKVTRDRIMVAADAVHPGYAFDVHKGYCTPLHQSRLDELGPCGIPRMRYENVRRAATVRST